MVRSAFDSIARSTLTRQIYERLLEQILSGALQPGQRLIEAEIATTVGTSRGPVREAIGLLERDGLVRSDPFVGASIVQLDDREIVAIYSLRSVLEGYAAFLVARDRTREEIGELLVIIARMRATGGPRTRSRLRQLDAEFHGTLVRLAGDQQLWQLWHRMRMRLALYLSAVEEAFSDGERLACMHDGIVDAVLSGDPVVAERQVRAQLISNGVRWTALRGNVSRPGGPTTKSLRPIAHERVGDP